jgi:hypothetical protein
LDMLLYSLACIGNGIAAITVAKKRIVTIATALLFILLCNGFN